MFLGIRQKKTVPSLSFCSLIVAKGVGGRAGVQSGGRGVQFSKAVERPVYTSKKKWSGSDKNWKGSDKFLLVNDTWPMPVLPVPFKKGSIRAFFGTEGVKIGSVPTYFFFFQRVDARPLFGTDPRRFFPEPVVLLRQPFTANLMRFASSCALHLCGKVADKNKKAAPRKAAAKAVEPWKDCEVATLLDTFFQKHFPELSDTLFLRLKFVFSSVLSKRHKDSKKDSSIVF